MGNGEVWKIESLLYLLYPFRLRPFVRLDVHILLSTTYFYPLCFLALSNNYSKGKAGALPHTYEYTHTHTPAV